MKNVTIVLACLFLFLQAINSQQLNRDQVQRDKVIIEIGTGVTCPYCPAAANGAMNMIENGHDVAVIFYHNYSGGGIFGNTAAAGRCSYYGISSYPTAKFDGVLTQVGGGGSSQSNYTAYLAKYNQRIGITSSFTIDLTWEWISGNNYEAHVVVEKVDTYTGTNLKLQLALTESNIPYSWFGMTEVNYVERAMFPNYNGTSLDFSGGNTLEFTIPYTLNASWIKENCELVAFVQNNSGKEILQGTKSTMNTPDFDLDAELVKVGNVSDELCSGELEPEVTIKNKGADVLTTVMINCKVNDELVFQQQWTEELAFTESEMIELPLFTYPALENNTIEIFLSEPNGGIDENPDNNSITLEACPAPVVENMIVLILKTDNNPQETSWEVIEVATGNVVGSGGPYTQPNLFMKDTIWLVNPGCHKFIIYDAGGNGLSTYYTLRAKINGTLTTIKTGNMFGYKETTEFSYDAGVLTALFNADVMEGCEELTVNFTDNSFGNVTSWEWIFEGGDPATSTEQNPTVFYAVPGTYDVTLTVGDGTSTNALTKNDYISIFELPEVTFAEISDMCINWPPYEITEGAPAGGEYSGTGVEDGWFYPDVAGLGTHTLIYTYEDNNGCENFAEQTVYVDGCVGFDEVEKGSALNIYPNPITNSTKILFSIEDNSYVKLNVFNLIGKEVTTIIDGMMNSGTHAVSFDAAGLEAGIYFVRLQYNQNIYTEKITIVK